MLTLNSGSKKHWKCKYKKHILCSLYLKKYLAGNYKIDKYIHFLRAAWFCHKILSQMLSFSKILVVFGTNYAKLHKNIQLVPHVLTAIENFLLLYHHVLSAILYRTNWITPPPEWGGGGSKVTNLIGHPLWTVPTSSRLSSQKGWSDVQPQDWSDVQP